MKRRTDGRKEKDRLDVTFPTFLIFMSRPVGILVQLNQFLRLDFIQCLNTISSETT
jgi:hypothetical protein